MSPWLPVSSSRLRRRTLITPGGSFAKAALFPFFNRQGMVSRVMVVDAESARIWLFDPSQAQLRIPLVGPIDLRPAPSTMRPLDEQQLAALAGLWHFDPWWVLSDPRFARSATAQALKETNCVKRFPWRVTVFYYRRDLSRVSMILRRKRQGQEFTRFPSDVLPERPAAPPPPRRPHGAIAWRLDPFWLPAKR